MKPTPKSSEPLICSHKPDASQFGLASPTAWRVSGKTITIDELIEEQGKQVTSTDLRLLRAFTGRLLDKVQETNPNEYPGLREAVHAIVRVLESSAAQQATDPLPTWLTEIGFAAGYFLKRYDVIPDHVAEIGLADDALILQRVIQRNQSNIPQLPDCIDRPATNS
jgi:uncharacterized membrane protein YkvA (DUF1232 family)